jgi:hypothetical protein
MARNTDQDQHMIYSPRRTAIFEVPLLATIEVAAEYDLEARHLVQQALAQIALNISGLHGNGFTVRTIDPGP